MDVPPGMNGSEKVPESNNTSGALHQAVRPTGWSVHGSQLKYRKQPHAKKRGGAAMDIF
jgi:hypothetical protein